MSYIVMIPETRCRQRGWDTKCRVLFGAETRRTAVDADRPKGRLDAFFEGGATSLIILRRPSSWRGGYERYGSCKKIRRRPSTRRERL